MYIKNVTHRVPKFVIVNVQGNTVTPTLSGFFGDNKFNTRETSLTPQ
jgi:hypothetical protein